MIELTPGSRFGPYLVTRKLGSGGMGAVYAAQGEQGQEVALKLLDLSQADQEGTQRFQREAESHARVDRHPNVARIHGSGAVGVQPYLVMDLLAGGDLASRLQAGPLSSAEVRELGIALAEGLAHIHACGVFHRDLKPANVLFDDEGRPRLTDFGLARPVEATSLTQSGVILGTPGYMAPEQATGGEVSEATDVFGLGATLYAALAGRPPFVGATLFATLDLLLREPPPPLDPIVPAGLRAVIQRSLAKDPAARFPDARSFRDALVGAERVASGGSARIALVVAGLALLGLIGAWALGAFGSTAPPPSPTSTPPPSPTSTPTPSPSEPVASLAEWVLNEPLILEPGLGELAKRPPKIVTCAWISRDRFATVTDNGLLSTWRPGPAGEALVESRFVDGIRIHWDETWAFSPRPGWLAWSSRKSPMQFSALRGEGLPLALEREARVALPSGGEAFFLFGSSHVARWNPAGKDLGWSQDLRPPREGWDLLAVEGLGPSEVLLAWASSARSKNRYAGTIFQRARITDKELETPREVGRWNSLVRATYLEGESLFVGDQVGGLYVFGLSPSELEFKGRIASASGEAMSRAHPSRITGIARGPGGVLLSLGSGGGGKQATDWVVGDLRLWSPAGKAQGQLRFPGLGRCTRLLVSSDQRLALVQGQTKVVLVQLNLVPESR